jgi:hypothetical protein
MNYQEFTYWLQGFVEITNPDYILPHQLDIIRDHLNLVIDPNYKKEEIKKIDIVPTFCQEIKTAMSFSQPMNMSCGVIFASAHGNGNFNQQDNDPIHYVLMNHFQRN